MESPSPSLIETLVTNAQYMPTDNKPSKCEEICYREQEAIVSCVNYIRDASVTPDHGSDDSPSTHSTDRTKSACLAPAVALWTDCCTKANNIHVEDNS